LASAVLFVGFAVSFRWLIVGVSSGRVVVVVQIESRFVFHQWRESLFTIGIYPGDRIVFIEHVCRFFYRFFIL